MMDEGSGQAHPESTVRFEELPHADPIAFLGTARHPLSVPATSHDVEPPIRDDVLPRSRWVRRAVATALAAALVLPIAASFSTDESTAPRFISTPMTETPPTEPAQPAVFGVRQDLPPGGLSESAMPDRAMMSEERSIADWTDATQPRDGSGVATGPEPRAQEPPAEASVPVESRSADGVRPVSASRAASGRRFGPRPGVPTTLDFAAAMSAVASTNIGPLQCGPDAVGTAAVAVTFAPSGRAVRAVIENGSLRGTVTGSCVALRLRSVRIEPFEGDAATVRTSVFLR